MHSVGLLATSCTHAPAPSTKRQDQTKGQKQAPEGGPQAAEMIPANLPTTDRRKFLKRRIIQSDRCIPERERSHTSSSTPCHALKATRSVARTCPNVSPRSLPSLTDTQSQTTSTNIDHHTTRRQVTSSVHPSTPNSVLSVSTQNFLDDTTSGFEVSLYTYRQEELSKNLPPPPTNEQDAGGGVRTHSRQKSKSKGGHRGVEGKIGRMCDGFSIAHTISPFLTLQYRTDQSRQRNYPSYRTGPLRYLFSRSGQGPRRGTLVLPRNQASVLLKPHTP
ncbi:unnamed protein product, partial [Ectocarpus sp. 12 AP-2014]